MCLTVINKALPNKPIYVYKVLKLGYVNHGNKLHLHSPYRGTRTPFNQYIKPKNYDPNIGLGDVLHGECVHAYTTLKRAQKCCSSGYGRLIFKILVQPEDIIAFGSNSDIGLRKLKIRKQNCIFNSHFLQKIGKRR